ncbi:glycoside hydrolase family 2 protein [Methylobacterium sp. 37f]|uniref:glycoside hydrolase family 2 protein n=1 Tax=Methylobacterium sp. 37f TaxID=2817058 RepID=UPI001FFD1B73|nr:glycoside hydrolase family 2 protein [Methylobacterium sp. 37f]MCK2053833.1 glycoside hydrolase family 2 protein [Methylobacterium sp. 37f]
MARLRSIGGVAPRAVAGPWRLALTPPGACAGPGDLVERATDWIPAPVPGTVAAALRDAGRWSEAAPTPIHDRDAWYRTSLRETGPVRLRFEGLATLAEIWLDGVPVLVTRSMFEAYVIDADLRPGTDLASGTDLALCFRSLTAQLERPSKRGRWRPRMVTPGALRHVRTSLLGFMPGWCPAIDCVGPYRPVTVEPAPSRLAEADLRASLDGATGSLAARLRIPGRAASVTLRCDGREVHLTEAEPGLFVGTLELPGVAPWWPHTHGTPHLHPVTVDIDGMPFDLGRTGFRTLSLTRPFEAGLALAVNGVPIFCRGANWMPTDLVGLGSEEDAALVALAREAGMNMLRVSGTTLYPSSAFFDHCDAAGLLVWQDLMLANFDYPHDDPDFAASLAREVAGFLDRTQLAPSLAVLCGGSEVWQQAAMLGAPCSVWADAFCAETLPAQVATMRPDLLVVPNSPSGGDLPFSVSAGCTHYYGVGAYRRPLEDARRAELGFATECLAFANLPDPETPGGMDPSDPAWDAGIPRDRGADWDFEQVRDHYVALLYGVDPATLRATDPQRYLELGRAAVAEVMEATFAEWRRARSPTAGGLVWFLRDLGPGTGWGVIDRTQAPKSGWYALKRAFRPVQVTLSDEGLNGLHLHVHNETAEALTLGLRLTFADRTGRVAAKAERAVAIGPRASLTLSSSEMLGRFFDATDAYRFGPRIHDVAQACLTDASGTGLAESFHFPGPRPIARTAIGLRVEPVAGARTPTLRITTDHLALGVRVKSPGARPCDNGFHLAPGTERFVTFPGAHHLPQGEVSALNSQDIARFGHGV